MRLSMKNTINNDAVILRKAFPYRFFIGILRDCDEISPRNRPSTREISPFCRNDNLILTKLLLFNKGLKSILMLFLLAFILTPTSAQNTMQIDNVQGVINSTVTVPISITNDEEFISFQCDVLLPDGFNYVPGSITLTPRSTDHVVNVTNIEDNTIRILSYSLNNSVFLLDSGVVAKFSLSTPSTEGDYVVGIENGIIGNAQSINVLDSLVVGEISLVPIGVTENNLLQNKINCFPIPFKENLTIQIDVDDPQAIKLLVFDVRGTLLSNHNLEVISTGINNFSFNTYSLLGSNPTNGTYILHFSIQNKDQVYSFVKNIQFKK